MSDERPLKIIDTGGVKTLASFTDADALMWGGGVAIDSSDDVVLRDEVFDGGGLILTSILPPIAITNTFVVASQAAMLALTAETGDVAIRTDVGKSFILSTNSPSTLADWKELLAAGTSVVSVNGHTGVVVLTAADVGALTQTAADARYVLISATGDSSVGATGNVTVAADSDANAAGAILLSTAGTTKFTVTNTGVLQAGAALTTGVPVGAIVQPAGTGIYSASNDNLSVYQVAQLTTGNTILIDSNARGVRFNGPMGFNVAAQTTNVVRVTTAFTITGGTTLIAYNISPTYDLTGTNTMTGFNIKVNTVAGAPTYTTSDIYGVRVNTPALGSGHTATRNTGVYIDDQTGGTTNYSLRTNVGMVRFGDRVGIGGDPTTYGVLDVQSTTATIIIPRMTTAQKTAMTATNGMIVYDSTIGAVQGYQSGAWASYGLAGADNVNIAGVFFNVDSDASDGTNVDSFIWGRDRVATTGGTELMRLNAAGYLLLGTTVTTSVAAFDIVIPRGNFVRSVNNAGTDTKPLIGLDTTDTVLLGNGNVRVQSGIFLVNTAVTTSANSGDIVLANQRGLRILNSGSTTAYLAIDRTTNGTTQSVRLDPSALGPVLIGSPGYIDDATAGDLILQNANAVRISNAAGTASVKVLAMTGTGDTVVNGTNSLALQTATTDRLKIDSAGNVLLWAGAGLGGGALVVSIHNATTDPTTNPTAGGILYASGGALKWRGSSGTVTTIAPA